MTDERYRCPECHKMVTVGSEGVEYGHARGKTGEKERCSRRPSCVDPGQDGPAHAGWTGPERWVS